MKKSLKSLIIISVFTLGLIFVASNSYILNSITLNAGAAQITTYTISTKAVIGSGSFKIGTDSSPFTVGPGKNISITITPSAGYYLGNTYGCDGSLIRHKKILQLHCSLFNFYKLLRTSCHFDRARNEGREIL